MDFFQFTIPKYGCWNAFLTFCHGIFSLVNHFIGSSPTSRNQEKFKSGSDQKSVFFLIFFSFTNIHELQENRERRDVFP